MLLIQFGIIYFFNRRVLNEYIIYKIIKNMEYLDRYDRLIKILLEEVEIDGKKFDLKKDIDKFFISHNKTAGVRVRRVMQEIKKLSQEMRDDVQEYKDKI